MVESKSTLDQLIERVRSLISEDGYSFSDQDKILLKEILAKLEEMSGDNKGNPHRLMDILNLLFKFLEFFGIDEISQLF